MNRQHLETICHKVIDWAILGIIFFIPLYFAWFHENYTIFDLNKSVALWFFLIIAIISYLIIIVVSGRLPFTSSKKLSWAWLITLATILLSSLISLYPGISLLGSYERQQGFRNLLAYFLFFLLLIVFLRSRKQLYRLLIAAHLSSALICLYGVLQILGLDPLRWAESSESRIFSSFGQPNFFGHYLAVMIPLTIYACFFIARRPLARLGFMLIGLAELVCLVFTYSRSGWMALVVALGVGVVMSLWHLHHRKLSVAILAISVLTSVALVFPPIRSALIAHTDYTRLNFVSRLISIVDIGSGSTETRLKYWKAAIQAFKTAPLERKLFGFGPDVQSSVFVRQYQKDWGYYEQINSFPDRAHNAPLDMLLQVGLIGWVAFAWLVILILLPLFRRLKKMDREEYWLALAFITALIAYAFNNLFSFSLTAMAVMLYFLLGALWQIGTNFSPLKEYPVRFFHFSSRLAIMIAGSVLLIVLFYGFGIRPLIADYYYIQVKKAEFKGDCRATLDNMEKVMEWYPGENYYARAYLHHNINCFSAVSTLESRQQLIKNILEQTAAISPEETQFYTLTDLAHTYSLLGYYANPIYYQKAEAYYRELLDLNPYITVSYQDYGRMKLWQAKFSEARALFQRGIEATPSLDQAITGSEHTASIAQQLSYFHDLMGLTYFSENNFPLAIKEYLEAIAIDPKLTSPYKELADIAYKKRDFATAILYNKEAFAIETNNVLWPVDLATLYLEQGDKVSALRYALEAQKIDPENTDVKKLITKIQSS